LVLSNSSTWAHRHMQANLSNCWHKAAKIQVVADEADAHTIPQYGVV
jgi:hypothetical protein